MSDQTIKETAVHDGVIKEVLNTAAQFAGVGRKVDQLKENASHLVEDGINDAKRMVKRGRYAAKDLFEDTAHMIKHDPFRSVGVTFGIGFGLGAILGLLVAYKSKTSS